MLSKSRILQWNARETLCPRPLPASPELRLEGQLQVQRQRALRGVATGSLLRVRKQGEDVSVFMRQEYADETRKDQTQKLLLPAFQIMLCGVDEYTVHYFHRDVQVFSDYTPTL